MHLASKLWRGANSITLFYVFSSSATGHPSALCGPGRDFGFGQLMISRRDLVVDVEPDRWIGWTYSEVFILRAGEEKIYAVS